MVEIRYSSESAALLALRFAGINERFSLPFATAKQERWWKTRALLLAH